MNRSELKKPARQSLSPASPRAAAVMAVAGACAGVNDNTRPAAAPFIQWVDRGLLFAYGQISLTFRGLLNLTLTVIPLLALLVGSCKTSELPVAYNNADMPLRAALFPDRPVDTAALEGYTPAAGYVDGARAFVQSAPEVLTRLSQQEVAYLFGTPAVERHDADARIWQYSHGGCVVDFYFYADSGAAPAVSFVDYRLQGRERATGSAQGDCLKKIAERSVIAALFS